MIYKLTFKAGVQKFFAVGALNGIAVYQVQSAQQKVVGIDQIIADHGEVTCRVTESEIKVCQLDNVKNNLI